MAESLSKGTLLHNIYRIEEVRGKGASGFVYRAIESANPDRCWAVKEIISVKPGSDEDNDVLQQFERECSILKTLSHPSLTRLIDTFSENNRHCLVMDFVDGESLQDESACQGERYPYHGEYNLFMDTASHYMV